MLGITWVKNDFKEKGFPFSIFFTLMEARKLPIQDDRPETFHECIIELLQEKTPPRQNLSRGYGLLASEITILSAEFNQCRLIYSSLTSQVFNAGALSLSSDGDTSYQLGNKHYPSASKSCYAKWIEKLRSFHEMHY